MARRPRSPDDRALLVSVWASAVFAVVSLAWGLLVGSQTIVFDGLFSFASVLLSLAAVLALRTSRRGADDRYPWGREVWEPLTIVVKAVALGGLCVYALIGAVVEITRGGRDIDAGWALAYAVLATASGVVISIYLRRSAGRSDLVRAESAEWTGDTLLSVGVLLGFVVAVVLQANGRSDLARYVDPVMVAVISTAFLWVPARLLLAGFREILTMSPDSAVQEQLRSVVREVEAHYGFVESFLRSSKVGGRLDVEIDFVVDDGSRAQQVREFDVVRQDIHDRLAALDYATSVNVAFTADRKWAL